MLLVLSIFAELAILMGLAFILSKTLPRVPNRAWRFVLLFVLTVPMNFVVNRLNVALVGYHEMGWTTSLIAAFLLAAFGMFCLPEAHNSSMS